LGIVERRTMTPSEHLTGAKFEAIVKERCVQLKNLRLADIGRYGVQAVRTGDAWQVMQSLPDFEGVTRVKGGKRFSIRRFAVNHRSRWTNTV